MKFVTALMLVVACIGAQAAVAPRFPVVDHVEEYIKLLQQVIQDLGLDPWDWSDRVQYEAPVPEVFNAAATGENINFNGLSNIVIDELDYDFSKSALNINIVWPSVKASADAAKGDVNLFDYNIVGDIAGSLEVSEVRFAGSIVFDGMYAVKADIKSSLGAIKTALSNCVITGDDTYDIADLLNELGNEKIPQMINDFQDELDELFSIYAVWLINRLHDM